MDWGRAKTILIVSFLLLNLAIGYNLWISKWNLSAFSTDSQMNVKQTLQTLRQKNIQLQAGIPKTVPVLGEIRVQFVENVQHQQKTEINQPIPINRILHPKKSEKKSLHLPISFFNQYGYDSVISDANRYVFHQTYENYPMFDVNLFLYTKNGFLDSYEQAFVDVQSTEGQKKQKVISAYTAVRTLAENYLPKKAVITNIQLGYHGQIYNSETQYMLPSWRVSIAGGGLYYVHALNGDVEVSKQNQ